MHKELTSLFSKRTNNLDDWVVGKIPAHYKRLTVSKEERLELAKQGAAKLGAYFGVNLYFSQALIAGAILSDKYKEFVIVTPSQYGKSWLLGHVALLRAYLGRPIYVAGASGDQASIIMENVVTAVKEAVPEIQTELINRKDQIERLATSVSKTRVAFKGGGFVEAISLADTYQDNISRNKAVGRAGDFLVDEAALVSDNTFAEMGRREFANVSGEKYQMVMISNPHNPGSFYERLTEDEPPEDTFILWMDALTAVEEERFTEGQVANSEFARNKHQRRKYLLCELDVDGEGMFDRPIVYQGQYQTEYPQYFLGVDSAYKGKDNVCYALNIVSDEGKPHIDEVLVVDKGEWVDGVTSEQIIDDIARIANRYRVALIAVDTGAGIWLVEGLTRKGLPVLGVNFGSGATKARVRARHYAATTAADKRTEMHLDLQELIENGAAYFSEQAWETVKDVFPLVKDELLANGKRRVRKKAELKAQIGRSPDELDSILLSIHAAIVYGGEYNLYQ